MVIRQGDVVWVNLPPATGSSPGKKRPVVVLQHDRFNATRIATVVVVALTSKLKYAALPGNVRLRKGEANLPKDSVANVTQIATIDRDLVASRVGTLSKTRLFEIWSGVKLVCEP